MAEEFKPAAPLALHLGSISSPLRGGTLKVQGALYLWGGTWEESKFLGGLCKLSPPSPTVKLYFNSNYKKKCIIHQYFQPLVVQPTNTFLPTTVATQGVDFSAGGPENAPDLTRTRDHLGWVELPQGARPAWQMTGPSREPQPPRVFNHRSPRGIPSGGMCCGTSLPPPKP